MLIIIVFLFDFIISFEISLPSVLSVPSLHSNYFLHAAGTTVAVPLFCFVQCSLLSLPAESFYAVSACDARRCVCFGMRVLTKQLMDFGCILCCGNYYSSNQLLLVRRPTSAFYFV